MVLVGRAMALARGQKNGEGCEGGVDCIVGLF